MIIEDLRVHQCFLDGVQAKHHVVVRFLRLQDDLDDFLYHVVLHQSF